MNASMSNDDKELKEKIQKLVLDTIQVDKELRDQYQIGEKFKFIRDRLTALKDRIEGELQAIQQDSDSKNSIAEDEVVVYVYLYNAQGLVFNTWQKMISPSVFYEYSVNRPIYVNQADVESFIRSRSNKFQHAFLAIVIKKEEMLVSLEGAESLKDQVGNPLIKIKEGCLQIQKMISFMHQDHQYVLNDLGQLIKKQED